MGQVVTGSIVKRCRVGPHVHRLHHSNVSFLERRLTVPQVPNRSAQNATRVQSCAQNKYVQAPFSNKNFVEAHNAHGAKFVLEFLAPVRLSTNNAECSDVRDARAPRIKSPRVIWSKIIQVMQLKTCAVCDTALLCDIRGIAHLRDRS